MFNNHYINTVEKTSGIAPESLEDSPLSENDEETVLTKFQNIMKITQVFQNLNVIKLKL